MVIGRGFQYTRHFHICDVELVWCTVANQDSTYEFPSGDGKWLSRSGEDPILNASDVYIFQKWKSHVTLRLDRGSTFQCHFETGVIHIAKR